jgi:signal transduction histidine kinase
LKKITLRAKLSFLSSLLVLVVAVGVGISFYLSERRYLLESFQRSQLESAQHLAQIAREGLLQNNDQLINGYLTLIRRSPALSYALVMDSVGRVWAHSNNVQLGERPTDPVSQAALGSGDLLRQEIDSAGDRVVDLALPIFQKGRRLGTARVGYSRSAMGRMVDDALQAAWRRIALATLVALLVGLALALFVAALLARPIRTLRDGAHRIGEGDLGHRLPITSRDELGELAQEFNIMAAKLQELDQLKQDFVSNVTHELRSPLTSLRGYVEFLLRESAGPLNEEQRDCLIVVKNNAVRLARFIDNLLDIAKIEARKVELHPEAVAVDGLAKELEVIFRPQCEEKKISFSAHIPRNLPPL